MIDEISPRCRNTHDGSRCEFAEGHKDNHRSKLPLGGWREWANDSCGDRDEDSKVVCTLLKGHMTRHWGVTSEGNKVSWGLGTEDLVNHPPHYTHGPIEVIDIIEGFELGYHLGNVVKYILRHEQKGGLEDLRKALWYLARYIEKQT